MKKLFSLLALASMAFIATSCGGKQKVDTSLNGTWVTAPQSAQQSQMATSTFVIQFDNDNITVSEVAPGGMFAYDSELSKGTYELNNGTATFTIAEDTCPMVTNAPKSLTFTYSQVFNVLIPNTNIAATQLTINFSTGQTYVVYKQQTNQQVQSIDNLLSAATTGCFMANNSFQSAPPTPRN